MRKKRNFGDQSQIVPRQPRAVEFHWRAQSQFGEKNQPCTSRRRLSRGLYMGCSRPIACRWTARDYGNFRRVGRCTQCRDAGRWPHAWRARGSAQTSGGFLAGHQRGWRFAANSTRADRPFVLDDAVCIGPGAELVRGDVSLFFALRTQSAEYQSLEQPDRALRRL